MGGYKGSDEQKNKKLIVELLSFPSDKRMNTVVLFTKYYINHSSDDRHCPAIRSISRRPVGAIERPPLTSFVTILIPEGKGREWSKILESKRKAKSM